MAEEIKLIPITTTAGLQKFFQVSGLPEVKLKLTHIGFGDAGYTPSKNQTNLKNEIIRVPISSGKVFPSDGYMDLSALIPENVPEFWIREIGWYLEDGTLAFVWSHPEVPIAWKNKNLKLLAGISVRVTDVPLDKIEIVESNPDLKLLYTEEFMQIAQILTNHETAIVAIKDKADEAIATANAVKEELQNVQVPRITVLEERADKTEQNLLLEQLTDQTVLARIGNAITDLSEKLRLVNTSKLHEVEKEIDKIEKLLQQVKEKVDSDVIAGFQAEIDEIKTQIDNLKNVKADKDYVDITFVKTSVLDLYATKDYVTQQLSVYAPKSYVDKNFLKKSELDLKVYTFHGDSTVKWLKVATLDGIADNAGFSLQFKVMNNGDLGSLGRTTEFIHFTERSGYFQLTRFIISDIGKPYGAGAPSCDFGYVITGDHTADFYIKLNMYNMPVITDIFVWNGTLLFDNPLELTDEPENIHYATKKMLFNNQ